MMENNIKLFIILVWTIYIVSERTYSGGCAENYTILRVRVHKKCVYSRGDILALAIYYLLSWKYSHFVSQDWQSFYSHLQLIYREVSRRV